MEGEIKKFNLIEFCFETKTKFDIPITMQMHWSCTIKLKDNGKKERNKKLKN